MLAVSYGAAITSVALGALIGTLAIAGWRPVLDAWDALRPTHAWLNVFGFLSLVIAASLLHLLPTVAGTRIERTRTSTMVLVGLMAGPLVTAAGFVSRALPLAALGAALVVVSGLALGRHAVTVMQRRGRWTTDPDWHRFVEWSLLAAVGWFLVGSVLAAGAVVGASSVARGWDTPLVLGPLALGWAAQSLVGSWSHLVPSVGPGSPETHAHQRRLLGRWATARVGLAQTGVALVTLGITGRQHQVLATGVVLVIAYAALSVVLLGVAMWPVLRDARPRVPLVASGPTP
jgi:hypothetical protein